MKKLEKEEFINRCKEIHENKYDYSLTEYTTVKNKIKIICPEHGEIEIIASNHLYNRSGCYLCSEESHKLKIITKERLEKIKIIHNNKYLYKDLSINNSKIKITCEKHGEFIQSIYHHEKGHGCSKCFKKTIKNRLCELCNKEKEINNFIKKSTKCSECLDLLKNIKVKECFECGIEKEISNFPIHQNGNHRNYCDICFHIRSCKQKKKYKKENKEKIKNINKRYRKHRMDNDLVFRSKIYARNLIRKSISKKGYSKKSKTYKILGCSYIEFKEYLESKFSNGINWENRELWHIDHIIPISFADSEEEVILLNHYTNLKPIWSFENTIKSDRIEEKTDLYYKILELRKDE